MARGGRLGRPGAGMPGRAPRIQELVRLASGQPERAEDQASEPRRKHGRQSIRLTRNGFALHGQRLYVAKVGDIGVEWSRDLPSVPSSVTVIREPDGRYYASFVAEREAAPLPPCDREAGIDLGLASLAVTSDGQEIPNRGSCGQRTPARPRAADAVPQAEGFREPGQGPAPGRGPAPQGAGNPARPCAQDGPSDSP